MSFLVFAMHVSLWGQGGVGMGCGPGLCLSLSVSQGNYTPATIVFKDALRSHHLIADMADNETKILQCWELAVDEHIFDTELHSFIEAGRLCVAALHGRVVNER